MWHKDSVAIFRYLNQKSSSSKPTQHCCLTTAVRVFLRYLNYYRCVSSTSLPFWACQDFMHTGWSKSTGFWHASKYCWAQKLSIPPLLFLKWLKRAGALRDVRVYLVQRQFGRARAVVPGMQLISVFQQIGTLQQMKENQVQFSTSAWWNLIHSLIGTHIIHSGYMSPILTV